VLVVGFALFLQPLPLWVRTFELRALFVASLAAMAWIVNVASGMHGRHLGRVVEVSTGKTVVPRRRQRRGWPLIHGLYFEHHGDVDRVLVGPGGVLVLESSGYPAVPSCKRRGEGGRRARTGRPGPLRRKKGGSAAPRYGRDRLGVEVRPMVILWGPGGPRCQMAGSMSPASPCAKDEGAANGSRVSMSATSSPRSLTKQGASFEPS